MLKSLRIKNFKGWEDTSSITMAPISLFFGANSSGKSSIGQFLMMLKQTVESSDRKAVFLPEGINSAIQLGSYQEMVFHRDLANKISFDYEWSLPTSTKLKTPKSSKSYTYNCISFKAKVGVEGKDQHALVVEEFQYELKNNDEKCLSIGMERKPDSNSKYKVNSTDYLLKRHKGRVWHPGAPVRFYGFPNEVIAYHQNADFVQDLNLLHEKLFRSICYLGPLRTKTERLYPWTGTKPESVGYSGENTVAAILAAQDRKISLGYKKTAKPFEQIIAMQLKKMGLIEEFKVAPISEHRQEYEVKVRTKGSIDWVDLPDVGFGVSQVLPVLVQCFYAPANSIIIMEQPEIHLHPRAQSALADVMIEAINSRENGKDRNIQLIIETHSEHFLRRLQRRIAEDFVPQEKVSAYFANVSKTPARLDRLKINEFGHIQNWPENFFGDEMIDITKQAKAAMKKRMHHKSPKAEDAQ